MPRISIATPQEIVAVDRGALRELARVVLEGEQHLDYEISLAFVDNPTIHRLNKQFLDHDEPTDVLTFPLSDPSARKLTGEIVVGAEVALAQAQERGHNVAVELALLGVFLLVQPIADLLGQAPPDSWGLVVALCAIPAVLAADALVITAWLSG